MALLSHSTMVRCKETRAAGQLAMLVMLMVMALTVSLLEQLVQIQMIISV